MAAINRAPKKLRPLRINVKFFPRDLISMGAVIVPTITREVMKAEIVIIVAPERNKEPASGKAINDGIKVIAPRIAATPVAKNPASSPINLSMVSGVKIPKIKPTIPSSINKLGAVFRNPFVAILKALNVFCLFFQKENTKQIDNIL
jgi:hypothetical protein